MSPYAKYANYAKSLKFFPGGAETLVLPGWAFAIHFLKYLIQGHESLDFMHTPSNHRATGEAALFRVLVKMTEGVDNRPKNMDAGMNGRAPPTP